MTYSYVGQYIAYVGARTSRPKPGRHTDEYDCVTHLRQGDGLEAVLLVSRDHWVVGWLAVVGDRLEVIGLEVMPPLAPRWSRRVGLRMGEELLRKLQTLTEQLGNRPLTPLRSSTVRGLPLGRFLAERDAVMETSAATSNWPFGVVLADGRAAGLTNEEIQLLPYLEDAVIYDSALREGNRSPARLIADRRTISVRTAQGRIARARDLDLLEPSAPGVLGGGLTDYARDLIERVEIFGEAVRRKEHGKRN